MELKILKETFSICKIKDITSIPLDDEFVFFSKTDDELSLVCKNTSVPENTTDVDDGWKAMKIQGILDFSLIGILSEISRILAENNIGIFVVSTFNTDYILVKENNISKAAEVLSDEGYMIG